MNSLPDDSYNRVKLRVTVSYKRLKKSRLCMVVTYFHVTPLNFDTVS